MVVNIALGQAGWLVPGRWRWARALVWLVVLAVLCIMAFNVSADATLRLFAMASGEAFTSRAAAPTDARLMAVIIGSITMLGVYALTVAFVERRGIPELGLRRLLPDLGIGVIIGGVLIASIIGLMWIAGWVAISGTPITQLAESLKESVQSAVIEEVLMRIIIFRLLWRAAGVVPALILSASLFGGLHLLNPDATVFAALCLVAGEGIGIGLYLLTGRVWMSIGMHAGWNFVQGWVFGSAVSGLSDFAGGPLQTLPVDGVAPILSGGGFGPESSLAALFISLLASMIFLGVAWKKGRFATAKDR
ncbi:type II CAAX endopeptidase family protein [uncultured Maricaulis sp.]|uniref:CPBP family intramembrane glutamic endopeptidase n=1 Tax=uncultured Maricaulis sp. TaxID=174710 RepID=UPI0030D9167C